MRHRTAITTGALAAVLAGTAISGCSSSDRTSDDAPSTTSSAPAATESADTGSGTVAPSKAPGRTVGHLDFTGDDTGSADFTGGVKCEIKGGKLIGVTTPDVVAKTQSFPAFLATTDASPTQVALFAAPDKKTYSGQLTTSGAVTAQHSGSTWTVTVRGLQIAANYGGSGGVVTLNGSFTCTHLA